MISPIVFSVSIINYIFENVDLSLPRYGMGISLFAEGNEGEMWVVVNCQK